MLNLRFWFALIYMNEVLKLLLSDVQLKPKFDSSMMLQLVKQIPEKQNDGSL